MGNVLCFGELLLRFSPAAGGEWMHAASMPVYVGGAELNTANALSRWGIPVSYMTALPDHYLADDILAELRRNGIKTDKVIREGERIGTYYLPQGIDLKNAGVIYDRKHSSFWNLKPGRINWDQVFEDVSWLHFSAISPALNAEVAAACLEAIEVASSRNITISVDLNYRARLWQWGKQPAELMPQLTRHATVVMGNIWSAETMLGVEIDKNFVKEKSACIEQSKQTSAQIVRMFPKCREVANTFRFDGEGKVRYYATLFSEGEIYVSDERSTDEVVDKVGSGDTFMAGLIYGRLMELGPQERIEFATAAAFRKLFIKGDHTTDTVDSIKKSYS